jgi:hypothetical protein
MRTSQGKTAKSAKTMSRPYVISAVTQRHLNRDHTLSQPWGHMLSQP